MAQYHSTHTGQQIDAAVTLVNTCTDTDSSTGNVPSSSNKLATVNIVNSVLPTPTSGDDGKYLKVTESGQSYTWDIGVPDSADIPYDNTSSGLSATNLQDAIDEAISLVPDGLEIMSYGNSTWDQWLSAYRRGLVVYCRASSGSNPASGSQTRLAFMAYVNDAANPTEVEFQYYRSMNTHSQTNQGDEVHIYKLNKTNGWSYTARNAYSRLVNTDGSVDIVWSSGNKGQLTLSCATYVNNQITAAISDAIAGSY